MGDPIWLDTNVTSRALRGDAAVIDQLASLRRQGRQLLITKQVAEEQVFGKKARDIQGVSQTSTPARQRATSLALAQLEVELDERTFSIPEAKFNQYVTIEQHNVSYADRSVLAEVKASAEMRGVSNPQILTGELGAKGMASRTGSWGIGSVPAEVSKGGGVPRANINLEEYPPDEQGPILKFFNDRPFIAKLAEAGAKLGAQYIASKMMSEVMDHFKSEIDDARKALETSHPNPTLLKAQAGLEPYKRAYEAALQQVMAADTARKWEAVILAFTPDNNIDATKAKLDQQIAKVKSAADGKLSDFGKVAGEYVDVLTKLYKKVADSATGLDDIAKGVEKRGAVFKSAGDGLEDTFWRYYPVVAAFPLAAYEWMNVYNVADNLQDVARKIIDFANDVRARLSGCETVLGDLDQELQRVGDATYKFGV
jgi:uncharacterized protein YukE